MKPFVDPAGDTDILLVDDDAILRDLFAQVLSRAGYRVFTAPDGRTGLEVLKRGTIPLLITDLCMEGMDGLELITRIRKRLPEVKILAISGGGALDARECLDIASAVGADESLAKPFAAAELLRVVAQLLPNHPLRDF